MTPINNLNWKKVYVLYVVPSGIQRIHTNWFNKLNIDFIRMQNSPIGTECG